MMYRCYDCGRLFDEPGEYETTYESYFGAPILTSTPLTVHVCPHCHSEDYEEYYENDEEEEDEL